MIMKSSIVTILFISLIVSFALLDIANAASIAPATAPAPSHAADFCNEKCDERCELKGPYSRCKSYCLMCCGKCKCVPSGTTGNLDECPCYRDWKSPKNGRPKCP